MGSPGTYLLPGLGISWDFSEVPNLPQGPRCSPDLSPSPLGLGLSPGSGLGDEAQSGGGPTFQTCKPAAHIQTRGASPGEARALLKSTGTHGLVTTSLTRPHLQPQLPVGPQRWLNSTEYL